MSIDVDLDQPPAPVDQGGWFDNPKRVVTAVLVMGAIAIAVAAVTMPSWRGTPAPAAAPSPTASACQLGLAVPPLPAFTITLATAGDLYEYEDTGRWTWQQMIWIPAAFESQPDLRLIELQTARGPIGVATGGPHQLAVLAGTTKVLVDFAPAAVYGRWVSLSLVSADLPGSDELTVSLADADGGITSQEVPLGEEFHSTLIGFGLPAPAGTAAVVESGPDSDVKYGPPAFSAIC